MNYILLITHVVLHGNMVAVNPAPFKHDVESFDTMYDCNKRGYDIVTSNPVNEGYVMWTCERFRK